METDTIRPTPQISSDAAPRHSSSGERSKRPKKVRSACERCRYRRIKCDGQTPACGNCAKSGSTCIDVDGHNDERRVSRGFMESAIARIAWLEDIIRSQLPHINLDNGPYPPQGRLAGAINNHCWGDGEQPASPRLVDEFSLQSSPSFLLHPNSNTQMGAVHGEDMNPSSPWRSSGSKRPLSSIHAKTNRESSVEEDTRSVALGLGFLSLNSDSRQLHYLGSSSGSLLASLVQTGGAYINEVDRTSAVAAQPDLDGIVDAGHQNSTSADVVRFEVLKTSVNDLYARLRKVLPPRKDCDILCQQYFSKLQPNHPFLHRSSFQTMIDALYKCAATEQSSPLQHNGWPESVEAFDFNGEEHVSNGRTLIPIPVHVAAFQLLLVLSIGATLQIRRRLYHHDPESFFNSAMTLSKYVFNNISLPSLQAILVLLVYTLVGPSRHDVWTLSHLAMAHSIDMGIHREIEDNLKLSKVAVEMRRRIFFCVYSFDRSISTIQGRPFSLADGFYDVKLPSLSFEEAAYTDGEVLSNAVGDRESMNYSIHLFKMAQLASRIKTLFYRLSQPPDGTPWATDIAAAQKQLRNDLEQWVAEVPSVVLFVPAELKLRLTTKLQLHYHGTMCLLHQSSQAIVQPSDQALEMCYYHAAERLRLYESLYESGGLVFSWRTVHDIYLAGTTVMYSVWVSSAVRANISLPVLASICRRCSSLLSVGGEWWPVTRKSKLSLERLASRTIEMFSEKSQPLEPPASEPLGSFSYVEAAGDLSTAWLPEHIEEALTSVLNHDHNGQLSQIFLTPTNPTFSTSRFGLNSNSPTDYHSLWASFDSYASENS